MTFRLHPHSENKSQQSRSLDPEFDARQIELYWVHPECGYIFKNSYYNIQRSQANPFCRVCNVGVHQGLIMIDTENVFHEYLVEPLRAEIPISQLVPNYHLLQFRNLQHPRVRIDISGTLIINNNVIHIAVEYQGEQHYDFQFYKVLQIIDDNAAGRPLKTDAEYFLDWQAYKARDQAKKDLYRRLNALGYYLIEVPYEIEQNDREAYIRLKFWQQYIKSF